jgi:predicted nuclease of predicted toxin-antitoxin system
MRLILDIHVPIAVARGLQAVGIDVVPAATWNDGIIRTAPDEIILTVAAQEDRVLVSYDAKTLRPLAKNWAELGQHHAGIILIDDHTFRQNDIGGIVRALRALVSERGDEDWRDRIEYL